MNFIAIEIEESADDLADRLEPRAADRNCT